MLSKIKEKMKLAEDFLFKPHSCLCCRRECEDDVYRICASCREKIEFTNGNFCKWCGVGLAEGNEFCLTCQNNSYNFDYARSLMTYNEFSAPIILNFKFGSLKTHARPLGKMLSDYYSASGIKADVVTFVPMPKKREKERGYNQARELAKEFATFQNMNLVDALLRVKENVKQSTLSARERAENIKGSFDAQNKELFKGKDVLLIDDVLTTGATASECARVLKRAGAKSVVVLTIAKTKLDSLNYEL